ncbi:MAG: sugar transferase [Planctomycetota bacterium]|jgi:lipopolysaccharide/colanic/teichoic acid biosynthesis glycosyltransferase
MNLIIIRKSKNSATSSNDDLLRFAISSEPVGDVIIDGLSKNLCLDGDTNATVAIPERWSIEARAATTKMIAYTKNVPICSELLRKTKRNSWLIISNGRFATHVDGELLHKVLAGIHADVVAVNVEPELLGKQEKVRLTAQGKVAGFRRLYSDSAEPAPVPADWPHHVFVKTNVLDQVLADHLLPQSFSDFINKCRSNALTLQAISVGGTVLDLETEQDLLSFLAARLNSSGQNHHNTNNKSQKEILDKDSITISDSARLFGEVLLGQNVGISQNAIIVGPTIIGNNVRIGSSAVINSSIIGPGVCVPQNQLVQNCVVKGPQYNWKHLTRYKNNNSKQICYPKFDLNHQQRTKDTFRGWPRISYARCFKRIADIVAAITVLIIFAPVLPIIALVIKLTSRGPVFFRDIRQGLHGKAFSCLKFRTMLVGADKIQDKLRTISQVDGPQFKMEDDPRLSAIGSFLRDTYIDEIPQFFNVLIGQMSVVGPRPSPETENTLCPSWRDARLSVRPGITGLWQVCRTRQPMKDFQEWIHYDTKYVRDLSLKMDLWICWRTAKKLVKNFVSQF